MKRNTLTSRRGIALISVLAIIMAVTIAAFAYIAGSDSELAYGRNVTVREELDLLAQSGLEHAKAMILSMQDVDLGSDEYWRGEQARQLSSGNLFYDIHVERASSGVNPASTFDVRSEAYRLTNGERTASSILSGQLRLDPCVAIWCGGGSLLGRNVAVNGDIDIRGSLTLYGAVNGDAFILGSISTGFGGYILGRTAYSGSPVELPEMGRELFAPSYLYGSSEAWPLIADANELLDWSYSPTGANPAGIVYAPKDLALDGGNVINGTLVVDGDMIVRESGNRISAVRGFPALVVYGNLVLEENAGLDVDGLVVVMKEVKLLDYVSDIDINVNGGLYAGKGSVLGSSTSSYSITVNANHARTALRLWPEVSDPLDWSQAGGAFYRNIAHESP